MTESSRLFLEVHPVVPSTDVNRSIEFYAKLGFVLTFVDDRMNPRYACLRREAVEIHVQWNEPPANVGDDRPVYRFLVSDPDRLYEEFHSRSAEILARTDETAWHRPAETPWGTREFHVRDPDRNGLQFYRASGG